MARVTARRRARFLEVLSKCANVAAAARAAEFSRQHAYRLRARDPRFAAAWDEALAEAVDGLAQLAWQRAVEGVEEPVYYRGEVVGQRRRTCNQLLMFLLRAHRPEVYGTAARAPAAAPTDRPAAPDAAPGEQARSDPGSEPECEPEPTAKTRGFTRLNGPEDAPDGDEAIQSADGEWRLRSELKARDAWWGEPYDRYRKNLEAYKARCRAQDRPITAQGVEPRPEDWERYNAAKTRARANGDPWPPPSTEPIPGIDACERLR